MGQAKAKCLTTRADYAAAAAKVISEEGHAGKVYELAGDNARTLSNWLRN